MNFAELLESLGPNYVFDIVNSQRASGGYLWASFLPERALASYTASTANMVVRSTMAGLIGMDSPYPPTGLITASSFNEATLKTGAEVRLSEAALRTIQDMVMRLRGNNAPAPRITELLSTELLNFINRVIVQPHLDTAEYLRSRAIANGLIDWTYGDVRAEVDYGIPAENKIALAAGAEGYGGASTTFWADMRAGRARLKNSVRAIIMHPDTAQMIVDNPDNHIEVTGQGDGFWNIRKWVQRGAGTELSNDRRDSTTLITYGREGEYLHPTLRNQSVTLPFMPLGRIVMIGNNVQTGYQVGMGSTDDPNANASLGYTHLAPTTEGNGVPGRWAELYTPERTPWAVSGRGASNLLPVIFAPDKIVHLSTDMS